MLFERGKTRHIRMTWVGHRIRPGHSVGLQADHFLANKEIVLCWIPSHIGIQGNEMVDQQAKASLSLEPASFKIPFSNFKPSINKYILEEWQTLWNNSIGNKLLDIKPTIGEYQSVV